MDVQLASLVFAATNNTSISEEIDKYLCVWCRSIQGGQDKETPNAFIIPVLSLSSFHFVKNGIFSL